MKRDTINLSGDTLRRVLCAIYRLCDDRDIASRLNVTHNTTLCPEDTKELFEFIYQIVIIHHFSRAMDEKKSASYALLSKLTENLRTVKEQLKLLENLEQGVLAPVAVMGLRDAHSNFQREFDTFQNVLAAVFDAFNLERKPAKKGRKKKQRDDMWFRLAEAYKAGGGNDKCIIPPNPRHY